MQGMIRVPNSRCLLHALVELYVFLSLLPAGCANGLVVRGLHGQKWVCARKAAMRPPSLPSSTTMAAQLAMSSSAWR